MMKLLQPFLWLFFLCITVQEVNAQVGINTETPNASAVLDIVSKNNDKGLLIPRIPLLSTTDISTIPSPATSLIVYNTTNNASITKGFYYWDSSKWLRITDKTERLFYGTSAPVVSGSDLAGDIYINKTSGELFVFNGTNWVNATPSSGWLLTGNSGTSPSTHFLGTIDDKDLVFKINNTEAGRLSVYEFSAAYGLNATAAYKSVSVGNNAGNAQTEAVAVGESAKSQFQSVSIGSSAQNSGTESVAVGASASSAFQAVAVGKSALATQNGTVAIGQNARANVNQNAISIGQNSTASGQNSTAIGQGATASATNATAVGYNTTANQNNTVILGNGANVGIGTSAPNNKLEITQGTAGNSGLRFTNLPNAALLSTNVNGDVIASSNVNSMPIAGDVTGTIGATTVTKIQGRNVATIAPLDGQVLTWDSTTSTWKPATIGVFSVVTVTGTTYTLTSADHGKIFDFTSNSAVTLTVPNTLPIGFQISITQAGTGQVTISGSGGMVINNRWNGTKTSGRWAKAGLEVRATNSSVLSGDVQ